MNIKYSHILAASPHEYFQSGYYIILSHLSTYFDDSILVDLGTHTGKSAAALSFNKSNVVYTYDIRTQDEAVQRVNEEGNIRYIIGDCISDNWTGMAMLPGVEPKSDKEVFLSSKLIFLDVDPHDGQKEDLVTKFLVSNNWKGILVCDDIGAEWIDEFRAASYSTLPIREWWDRINLPKFNVINNYFVDTNISIEVKLKS